MKTLILLAFMLIVNVFAGEIQETMCGNKSLSYCINHFDRQCKAKDYFACFIVGILYYEQEQYSKAKKYFEMVCDKANSKDSYGMEFIDSKVVKIPATEFIGTTCDYLGRFYSTGKGVRQSNEKAFQYHKKACDLGVGIGCAGVGIVYYEGKGVKKDLNLAIKFFAKSCELKFGSSCFRLGVLYKYGIDVKQNLSKAKELFGKDCDLGNQKGCDYYKELKEKGY